MRNYCEKHGIPKDRIKNGIGFFGDSTALLQAAIEYLGRERFAEGAGI